MCFWFALLLLSFSICANICWLLASVLIPLAFLCLATLRISPFHLSCSLDLLLFSSCLSDSSAEVMEVDHDRQLVFCETLCVSSLTALSPGRVKGGACSSSAAGLGLLGATQPSDEQVAGRLSAPVVTTQLDTRNIAFERSEAVETYSKYEFVEYLITGSYKRSQVYAISPNCHQTQNSQAQMIWYTACDGYLFFHWTRRSVIFSSNNSYSTIQRNAATEHVLLVVLFFFLIRKRENDSFVATVEFLSLF